MEAIKSILQYPMAQTLIIAAITGIAAKIFSARGKLIWGVSHQHMYRMPNANGQGTFPVATQQIWFRNVGRLPITNVEIVLNWKPTHFEIWEPREWSSADLSDGRIAIKIPTLNQKEGFALSLIETSADLPSVVNVRWNGGIGRNVVMHPQRAYPHWFNVGVLLLMGLGLITIIYSIVILANHILVL